MGNTQPKNRTGKTATAQKLENAKKLGVLSLSEHELDTVPESVFNLRNLRNLDLSKNKLSSLGGMGLLTELKSLNLSQNALQALGDSLVECSKLQILNVGGNRLGSSSHKDSALSLPPSIKNLTLASNGFRSIPRGIVSKALVKLERLDLSMNQLATIPPNISILTSLTELVLDHNRISFLPGQIGELKKLKVLSLKNNQISVLSTKFSSSNPQPLPKALFTETLLIDLNLHGNAMTNTQLNDFDGFQSFLDRRQKVKSKTMTNLSVCGLS